MWTQSTLGEICKMYQPKTIPKKEMVDNGAYPVFGANGIIGRFNEYNHKDPQLLITCRGATCGSVNISEPFSWINGNAMVIQPAQEKVSLEYMEYIFRGGIDLAKAITGAAQPQITRKSLEKICFSYPPLHEQKHIVAKIKTSFSEIDFAIKSTKRKREEVSILYESIISNEFKRLKKYMKKRLCDVCEKITDGTHQTPKYFDDGYVFLSSKNVTSRKIDWANVRYIDKKQHEELQKRVSPRMGDILLAKNGTTGVAAIVDKKEVFDIYVSLAWLRSKGEVLPEYLLEYLNSKMARDQFKTRTKGIGVPNLHLREIKEVEIIFPNDLKEQKSIVNKLKKIDDACILFIEIIDRKIQGLISLKKAILSNELNF